MLTVASLIFLLISAENSAADIKLSPAQACIATNSGADSVICLQQLEAGLQQKIRRQQAALQKRWRSLRDAGELTETHYQVAVTESRLANRAFLQFTTNQCQAMTGARGAVASGYGQVYWTCRIDWAQQRLAYLLRQKP